MSTPTPDTCDARYSKPKVFGSWRISPQPIERDGARFWLAGVNDALSGTRRLIEDIAQCSRQTRPSFCSRTSPTSPMRPARFPIDLQLSGHSHGGQVRIPLLPPLYLPEMAKKYVLGTYQVGRLTLYTNAGLGTVEIPVRLELSARNHAVDPATASSSGHLNGVRVCANMCNCLHIGNPPQSYSSCKQLIINSYLELTGWPQTCRS